jgi:CSLREA domain-containing protein
MRHVRVVQEGTSQGRRSALLVCAVMLAVAGTSYGAIFSVTKTEDTNDGACNADCSLREAIIAANSNPGSDSVTLPAGRFTVTIPGAGENDCVTGDLDIKGSLTLSGQGPGLTVIDANGLGDRVINVLTPGNLVTLVGLTVTGGDCSDSGGGIWLYDGHLVLSNVVVAGNHTSAHGGGIYSYLAELTVQDGSIIADNAVSAEWCGGGLTGNDVTITNSTVSGNQAGCGGGIAAGGSLTISGSTIAYNRTLGFDGGAIDAGGAQVEISNSTLIGNYSARIGGAILATEGTTLTLHSVTLSGNSSPGDNTLHSAGSSINFINTLVSGACYWESGATAISYGGNLESPGDTCGLVATIDQVNVSDPMLAPLAHYGGPTRTMLPLPGSPAVGAGSNGYCLSYDQRGELRGDPLCDVGAVERQGDEQEPIFIDGFESGGTSAW